MKHPRMTAAATAAAVALALGTAQACDDHHGTCEIEDWRWRAVMGGMVMIDGVATCNEGHLVLRLYEGEEGPFLGVANTYIEGHAFTSFATDVPKPSDVVIKYSINPD